MQDIFAYNLISLTLIHNKIMYFTHKLINSLIENIMRPANRSLKQIRPVKIIRNFTCHADSSVLIALGKTLVLCTATVENTVPNFLKGQGKGWITAEYGMLPSATHSRNKREAVQGNQYGRTLEIQRLISRSLRAAVDLSKLGALTIIFDCDVLQADGGTRTAAITGAYVALVDVLNRLKKKRTVIEDPLKGFMAAVSVGIVEGEARCDLEYVEDCIADTDMNVVMMEDGRIIEVQSTAEGELLSKQELMTLLDIAHIGINSLIKNQKSALLANQYKAHQDFNLMNNPIFYAI